MVVPLMMEDENITKSTDKEHRAIALPALTAGKTYYRKTEDSDSLLPQIQ